MKYRKLRIAWSVVCGIATVLIVVFWVRSYWHADSITRVGNDQILTRFGTASGTLFFGCADYKTTPNIHSPEETDGWMYQEYDSIPLIKVAGWKFNWGATERLITLPAWFVTLLFFTLATAPWLHPTAWQFSLRTMFLTLTAASVVFGLLAWAVRG
jgi:hypothetical protein